jgi:hypothetical protein
VKSFVILIALATGACAPAGYMYDVGNFTHPHPTPALCASRGQVLDLSIEDCVTPAATQTVPMVAAGFSNPGETYEQDKIWGDRIEHGACSRLRDRRTDSPADIAECNRDYATTPVCISYKGFASVWYDMAGDPNPAVSSPTYAMANLNGLGTKGQVTDPPYYRSPQFQESLRRLLNVAFSPGRTKWSTRDQFANYAYKACMEGHYF